MKKQFFIVAFLATASLSTMAQAKDPVIMNVAGENISKSEFERVFRKNSSKDSTFSKQDVNDYMKLYVNYKLKVREALEMQKDTVKSFRDELNGYRKQLAQPYLVDKQVSENLIREAYDRMQQDVRASHVLVKCTPDALPKDTLEAYNKAMKIKQEVMKGADFATIAKTRSDDPSGKENGGDLGYFTSMQMVYPFESAVYAGKVGEVSNPVRTRFGYHIIKVTDKRAAQGEIKVAHIMVKTKEKMTAEDSTNAVTKVNEIYGKLKGGENFEDLARQFSDDQGTAKNGGVLPVFGTGRMVPEFESAAFGLRNVGDYSAPVKTAYGYHIIKLLEKKPLATYESMQADLKQKVQKDSRSELSKTTMINRIKSENKFTENAKAKDMMMTMADSSLVQGKWMAEKAGKMNETMFTIGSNSFKQSDFAKYIESHQAKRTSGDAKGIMSNLYSEFVNESAIAFEESRLDEKYPEFKALMQEYRDGILLFELMDEKVWSKAVKDTTGLRDFHAKNKNNYMWPDRVDAVIYTCANASVAKDARKWMKTIEDVDTLAARVNQSSKLNLQVKQGKFAKGDNATIDAIQWKKGLTKDMNEGDKVVFVDVKNVMPSQPKTLEEAKGLITADYQTFLEKQWLDELHAKYKVSINQDVVDSIATR